MLQTQAVGIDALCFLLLSALQLQRQSPALSGVSLDLLFSFISSCENLDFHALQRGTIKCERTVRFWSRCLICLDLACSLDFGRSPECQRCPQNCHTATLRVNILCPVRRINVPLLTGDPLPGFPHRAAIVLSIFLVAIWETDISMVTVILMAAGSL